MLTSHTTIEVFADVTCPFTHVGLRRFVRRRSELGRDDVGLWVRAWPLEVVNGAPLEPGFVAEEIDDIRAQVDETLFAGFAEATFPATSLPALALAAAAYRRDGGTGERVSLQLRGLLFEHGVDISDPDVLARVAEDHGVVVAAVDREQVLADHAAGQARGVIGSPHFFTPSGDFFCPSLEVHRDDAGELRIVIDSARFDRFIDACFA